MPGSVPKAAGDWRSRRRAILLAVLGAIVGGLLLNLMPCVFPILALKALHLRAPARMGARAADALAYAAGAIVGTGALGVALLAIRAGGTRGGWAFQLQDPRTVVLLLLLATAIALNCSGCSSCRCSPDAPGRRGASATGALAAFVATPCAGPFLGAALGTALLLPPAGSVAVFAALGLGLALPFLLGRLCAGVSRTAAEAGRMDGAAAAVPRDSDGGDARRRACGCCTGRRARKRCSFVPVPCCVLILASIALVGGGSARAEPLALAAAVASSA